MRVRIFPVLPILLLCSIAGALFAVSQSWGSIRLALAGGEDGRSYPIRIRLPSTQGKNSVTPAPLAAPGEAPSPLASEGPPGADPLTTVSERTELSAANRPASDGGASPGKLTGTDRLLALEFNLADPFARPKGEASQADLEMEKTIRINGSASARAKIRVGADETLSIERTELVGLLEGAGLQDVATRLGMGRELKPYVSFQEIRQQGVNLRYDPVTDQVLLSR